MTVFADTFALIAWLNPRDSAHSDVVRYLEGYSGRLLTSEWVLMELADALANPPTRPLVVNFLRAIRSDPQFTIVGFVPDIHHAGFELFASRPDKAWSLTDCISFAIMSEFGVLDSLTADRHFEQAGFQPLFVR